MVFARRNGKVVRKKEFGPLYAKASNGKTKVWSCAVIEDNKGLVTLNVIHGYADGKKTTDTRDVEPKNVGKLNETTRWDQGLSEAQSKENKKRDEGYLDTIDEVAITDKIFLPMLANKFSEKKHKIVYPAFIQPKLDGVRVLGKNETTPEYISRKGKKYNALEHLSEDIKEVIKIFKTSDGEAYNHDLSLQEISAATKKENEDSSSLQYWFFDYINTKQDYETRKTEINKFFDKNANKDIVFGDDQLTIRTINNRIIEVPTFEVQNEEEVEKYHKLFVSLGFEGTMIRNKKGLYKANHRSNDLIKRKDYLEEEFKIIDGKEGTGNDIGTVIFTCVTKEEKKFDVRPKGSRKLRKKWLKELPSLINKLLTVRFQLWSDSGIPCQLRGICIRDYE